MNRVPLALLAVAYVLVAAWSASWPDGTLIPDEVPAKAMADTVRERGVPWHEEPLRGYRDGLFGADRYGGFYEDHTLASPPVGVAVAYEQGVLGAKIGRAITLAIGTVAIAYLAWRMAGEWAAFFVGVLYLTHPAVLYFHQSYFTNSGGTAYFLAALALLEAARRRWWLAPLAAVAGGVSLLFRMEYGMGLLAAVVVAAVLGPLRQWRSVAAFYVPLAVPALALWTLPAWAPGLATRIFKDRFDPREAIANPFGFARDAIARYEAQGDSSGFASPVFIQNVHDYFPWFFPLTFIAALATVFVRFRDRAAAWCLVPLGVQSLLNGYAVLTTLTGHDFTGFSWLESSIVRYFLAFYALTALLCGIALAEVVERVARHTALLPARLRHAAGPALAVAVALLVGSAGIVHALQADHGVAWANERRAWFNAIDEAAAGLGEDAVFVGQTPAKVIHSRPVMVPGNAQGRDDELTAVAVDLIAKGHEVYALEPWYWEDWSETNPASKLLHGGHTYWTDTGVRVDGPEHYFARFYELHHTNASLVNVERLGTGHFGETEHGLRATANDSYFWPGRTLHIAMGLAQAGAVTVSFEYLDEANATHEAGFVNLPTYKPQNRHHQLVFHGNASGEWKRAEFTVPANTIVNGPFFITKDLTLRSLEVRPS